MHYRHKKATWPSIRRPPRRRKFLCQESDLPDYVITNKLSLRSYLGAFAF